MQVRPLSPKGGVSVEDLDLAGKFDAKVIGELNRLYDEHGLVIFRDQKLTKQQLLDATYLFGGPEINQATVKHDPDVPGVIVISTRGALGNVDAPADPQALVGDIDFHLDHAFLAAPNRGKLLYGIEVPKEGGMTGFIDGHQTYDALSDQLKHKLEGLHVVQSWSKAEETIAKNRKFQVKGDLLTKDAYPDTVYKIIHEHPHTGRKVLNMPPLWAKNIVEFPGAEGQELIQEVLNHILDPKFIYWHRYEPGDVTMWDNWRFLHAASGTPGQYHRTIWSVIIRGDIPFGYELARAA